MGRERLGDTAGYAVYNYERVPVLVPAVLLERGPFGPLLAAAPALDVLADELVGIGRSRLTVWVRGHAGEEARAARGQRLHGSRHDRHVDLVEVHDLIEVSQIRIRQNDDRTLAFLGGVEGMDRVLVAFSDGRRVKDDAGVVAGGAIASLIEVALAGHRGHSGGGSDAHDVHDDRRDADLVAVADRLLHQAEARPGGCRERLGAPPARSPKGVGAGDLVLGLEEAELRVIRSVTGRLRQDLGGGADGIAAEVARAGLDGAEQDGLVSLDESLGHQ